MNTKETNNSVTLESVTEGISNYRTTIKVLQAFTSLITWDVSSNGQIPGSQFTVGRRMDTSPKNKIQPDNYVTPDVVIQRTQNLGYVVEVKSALSQNLYNNWLDHVHQLQTYDDDLTGWWNDDGKIDTSCVVLLLEVTRSIPFKKYVDDLIQKGELTFIRPISIVDYSRPPSVKEFWFLRKIWGSIEDDDISNRLENGISVPIEKVVGNPFYGEKKFYDTVPPVEEYTMEILWQDIFNERRQSVDFDEKLQAWPIQVNVSELTKELQRLYGSEANMEREAKFPLNKWVQSALDAFVWLKLARKEENDDYIILFRLIIKEDIISYFFKWRHLSKKGISEEKSGQLSLFST